jgi:tetratricopeptide (TPR) repeat protein
MLRAILVAAITICATVLGTAAAEPASEAQPASRTSRTSRPAVQTRFALTLVTSTEPVADLERYQRDLPGWVVYQTRANIYGAATYVVRLGFFADVAEAYVVRRALLTRYPDTWTAAIGPQEYEAAMASRQVAATEPRKETVDPAAAAAAVRPPETATTQPVPARANILAIHLSSHTQSPELRPEELPASYQGYHLYVTPESAADTGRYQLRLGFFANRREAENARQELARRFPQARVVEVSAQEHLLTPQPPRGPPAGGAAALAAVSPAPAAPGAKDSPTVAGKDDTGAAGTVGAAAAGAAGFAAGATATVGETTAAAAATAAPIPPAAKTELPERSKSPAPPTADPAIEQEASQLLERARAELTAGNNTAALEPLERILRLPPNSASPDAQELAGVARERNGEIPRARAEYELYLKLYPEGDAADRVRQRLANLAAPAATAAKPSDKQRPTQVLTYGGLSQYYYYGASKIETQPFDLNSNPLDQTTLSLTDQSAIITSLDYTTRWRSERYDNRVVFRDTYTANFTDIDDTNRLNAAYYDLKDKQLDYGARVGRQPGNTAGILLPFDGARVNYGFASQWRGNLQGGKLVDYYTHYDKKFVGASLDAGTFAERWNTSVYVIGQEVDGISDREAVGAEVRYFDPRRSLFALLDYDTSYSVMNTAVLQGTWQTDGKGTYNLLVDRRKSPPMQTSNALIGETATSIRELLNTLSEEEIRQLAKARTATASVYQVGAAYPINSAWQLGGDVQLTNISATETIGTVPGTPGTGNQYTYALQATGTGVLSKRDSMTLRASYVAAPTFDGQALSAYSRTLFAERWALDVSLLYYTQRDSLDVELVRLTPTFKLGYNVKSNLVFEFEFGIERTDTSSTFAEENTTRRFGSLGYRWDF